jgi:ABC-type enterochelin transport system permease subunit
MPILYDPIALLHALAILMPLVLMLLGIGTMANYIADGRRDRTMVMLGMAIALLSLAIAFSAIAAATP